MNDTNGTCIAQPANRTSTVWIVSPDRNEQRMLETVLAFPGRRFRAFNTAEGLLDVLDDSEVDCILARTRLPRMSGLMLQAAINNAGAQVPLIFLAHKPRISTCVRVLKAGATDFFQMPCDEEALFESVQEAILQHAAARERMRERERVAARYRQLTKRQSQVLAFVVQGHANRAVAKALNIAEKTVKVHRGHVMRKMRAHSLPELVELARIAGVPFVRQRAWDS